MYSMKPTCLKIYKTFLKNISRNNTLQFLLNWFHILVYSSVCACRTSELFLGFGLHVSIGPLGLNFMGLFEIPWDINQNEMICEFWIAYHITNKHFLFPMN